MFEEVAQGIQNDISLFIHAVKVGREYKIVKSKLIEMLVVGR